MTLLMKRSNVPNEASLVARLGYGSEADGTVMELRYAYAQEKVSLPMQSVILVAWICNALQSRKPLIKRWRSQLYMPADLVH